MKIAFITPTKDRPDDIRKMLSSYMAQSHRPDQVILVDSSAEPVSDVVDEFPKLKIDYKRWAEKPSAAGQRNGGIELLRDDIDLVCFFDDDQVLHPDAMSKMLVLCGWIFYFCFERNTNIVRERVMGTVKASMKRDVEPAAVD